MSQTQVEGSAAGNMAKTDWVSIFKGLIIAGLAAAIPVAIDYLAGLNIVDKRSAAIVAIMGIALNILRKWLTNTQQEVRKVAVLLFACCLLGCGSLARAADRTDQTDRTDALSAGVQRLYVELIPTTSLYPRAAIVHRERVVERSRTVTAEADRRRRPLLAASRAAVVGPTRGVRVVSRGAVRAGRFVLPPYRHR